MIWELQISYMTLLNYKFARYKIQQKDVRDETEKKKETLETY